MVVAGSERGGEVSACAVLVSCRATRYLGIGMADTKLYTMQVFSSLDWISKQMLGS